MPAALASVLDSAVLETGTGSLFDLLSEVPCAHVALDAQVMGDRQGLLDGGVLELPEVPQRTRAVVGERTPIKGSDLASVDAIRRI